MQESNNPKNDYVFISDDINMYFKLKEMYYKKIISPLT